ncbi:TPA: hypothetical protein ACTXXA_002984, partial [Legionella anisa]
VAPGGTTGQILAKASNTNYDTEWVDAPGTYTVGQQAMGGIVFYVDSTGQHGLIAAKEDGDGGAFVQWGISQQTFATGDGIGAGNMNTVLAIAKQAAENDSTNSAVLVCANYAVQADGETTCANPGVASDTCYADWYLPSKFELNQLFLQKNTVGNFLADNYWSSTEVGSGAAWSQQFGSGVQGPDNKTFDSNPVRCVRAF